MQTAYSVETVSCFAASAARSVCQASVAHLTLAGNSHTPEKTWRSPSTCGYGVVFAPLVHQGYAILDARTLLDRDTCCLTAIDVPVASFHLSLSFQFDRESNAPVFSSATPTCRWTTNIARTRKYAYTASK